MQNNVVQSSLLQSYMQKAGINAQIGVQNNSPVQNQQPAINLEQKPDSFEKESNKGKAAKIALLTSVGISVTAGCIAAFRHKGGVVKTLKTGFSKIKNAFVDGSKKTNEALKNTKVTTENLADFQKGADNISNAKDSIIRHFLMKIPGYKKFDNWASNIYRNASLKTLNKTYTKAKDAVFYADDALLESAKKSGLDETGLQRLKELVQKRKSSLNEFTSKDAIKGRIDKIDSGIQRLDKDAWETIKGLKDDGVIEGTRKLSKKALAEERLQQAKKLQTSLIEPYKNMGLSDDEAKEFMDLVETVSKNSSSDVKNLVLRATKGYKKAFSKEKTDFFEKIRDINYGCAPADIISTAGTIGTLGLYTAQADTKEERVGVTLTTGIPLVVSLGTTIGMTTKMVGGAKALILGALTGLGANILGNQINKKYQEAKGTENAPKTIVTLDDYTNDAMATADKFIHGTQKTAY